MRIAIICTFLVNLLSMSFVGILYQDQLSEQRLKQQQAQLAFEAEVKQAEAREADYRKFPKLRIGPFTNKQTQLLAAAYHIGTPYGTDVCEVVQGILLQESLAGESPKVGGTHLPVGLRYYGVMQMKVAAVMDVIASHPSYSMKYFGKSHGITSEEVISKLMTDDLFSIQVGFDYFFKYHRKTQDLEESIVVWNQGPGGATRVEDPSSFGYTMSVMKHVLYNVRPFNKILRKKEASQHV